MKLSFIILAKFNLLFLQDNLLTSRTYVLLVNVNKKKHLGYYCLGHILKNCQ